MSQVIDYIDRNREKFLDQLFTLLRQKSISTRNEGVAECAELLARMMEEVGIKTTIYPTPRHPVVYGEAGPEGGLTVLVYGHYDVQPPEPLEEWTTPPFEPTVRNGKIFGRGTSDNKAQLFCYVKAVEALLETAGRLPVKIKFLYEGEEEIGSPNLAPFAREKKDLLRADLAFFSDSHIHESGRPLIILGLKGMVYVELRAKGAVRDQHSMRATSIPNPAWRLTWALNTLKDKNNRVLIPGFYDAVRPATSLEQEAVDRIPCDESVLLKQFGLESFLPGPAGSGYYRNLVFQPTCNIAGFLSGYVGEGSKTVLPSRAMAKVDLRLVPDQKPEDILARLRKHLADQGFGDIEIVTGHFLHPSRTPIDHPAVPMIKESLQEVYGLEPIVFPNIGGSGPNYVFTDILEMPCFVVPYATHDQNNHAPDESMDLEGFFKGVKTAVTAFDKLAARLK